MVGHVQMHHVPLRGQSNGVAPKRQTGNERKVAISVGSRVQRARDRRAVDGQHALVLARQCHSQQHIAAGNEIGAVRDCLDVQRVIRPGQRAAGSEGNGHRHNPR